NQLINTGLALIEQAQQEPMGAEPRLLLEQAIAQVKRGQEMFNAEYAKGVVAFNQKIEAVKAMNAETPAQVEALKKQLAELKMPDPSPPPAPVPIDPQLGFTVRKELLDRDAPKAVQPGPVQPAIQDFSAEYSSDPSLSAETPAAAPPPSAASS